MRIAFAALWVLSSLSATAVAQSGPYLASVTKPEAQLHVNPTNQSLTTETLKAGTQVLVHHEEENGMLAVQPSPGSNHCLSWVQVQFVEGFDVNKPTPQNVTVADDTTLAPGQVGSTEPSLYYRKTQVPAGTILTVIGPKSTVVDNGVQKSWYPVLPPAGDYRYIAKDAVKALQSVNTSFTVRENPSAGVAVSAPANAIVPASANIPPQPVAVLPALDPPTLPAGPTTVSSNAASTPPSPPPSAASPAPPSKPIVNNPLWAQAEAAEKEGRLDDAKKYYFQLARTMNEPGGDRDIANLCYTRIHSIREKERANSTALPAAATRSTLVNPPPLSTVNVAATTGGLQVQTDGGALRPAVAAVGKITHAQVWVDGRPTYVLETSPGVTTAYVVAGNGVDLERYLNRRVDVTGPSSKRKDLSLPLIEAKAVEVAQ